MRVILFGATGMIGQAVLLECLRDEGVTHVTAVGRRASGHAHPKLRDVVVPDAFSWMRTWEDVILQLGPHDACFFCLGISSLGMGEETYAHVTYELTIAVATVLVRQNPLMTFVYVSGRGSDSSQLGRVMWARVKGRTENALLALPFRTAYMFRLGAVVPVDGVRSSTWWYRLVHVVTGPLIPLLRRTFPDQVVTSAEVGRAMLLSVRSDQPSGIFENHEIAAIAREFAL